MSKGYVDGTDETSPRILSNLTIVRIIINPNEWCLGKTLPLFKVQAFAQLWHQHFGSSFGIFIITQSSYQNLESQYERKRHS